jgi:hypothetical protein
MITSWRKQLGAADQAALAPKRRGPKPDPSARQIQELHRDNARLQRVGPILHEGPERRIDLLPAGRMKKPDLLRQRTRRVLHLLLVGTQAVGIDEQGNLGGLGWSSRNNSSRFGPSVIVKKVTPVTLPLGRPSVLTRLYPTGSPPMVKTIGMAVVEPFAAEAETSPPPATRTAT